MSYLLWVISSKGTHGFKVVTTTDPEGDLHDWVAPMGCMHVSENHVRYGYTELAHDDEIWALLALLEDVEQRLKAAPMLKPWPLRSRWWAVKRKIQGIVDARERVGKEA